MHLPTAIHFLAAIDEILNRTKTILNDPQYAAAYILAEKASDLDGFVEAPQQTPISKQF